MRQTVYGDDPTEVAERFAAAGAGWIHVVDLDRAFGEGENEESVRRILGVVGARVRIQLGGGLRTLDRVRRALDLGVSRLVIGTGAASDPGFLGSVVASAPPGRVAVGVDARNGFVAVRGWTETSTLRAETLAKRAVAEGIPTVVYTDISRDGMLEGPDIVGAVSLQQVGARVIASGGISSLDDVRRVAEAGLAGAIVGRALYEGRIELGPALQAARADG